MAAVIEAHDFANVVDGPELDSQEGTGEEEVFASDYGAKIDPYDLILQELEVLMMDESLNDRSARDHASDVLLDRDVRAIHCGVGY